MCTLTIIPHEHGIRLGFNRDESRTRPIGLPPRVVRYGDWQGLMPIDPTSGGTWIAVNDAGLVFAIMNAYPGAKPPGPAAPKQSRGTIIPRFLDAATLEIAFSRTAAMQVADFAGFRLVMANAQYYAQVYSTGDAFDRAAPAVIPGSLMFTSSGLGDALVDAPRRALFDQWFVPGAIGGDLRDLQDAYHRHSWPDRPHISVCMRRPEARTVSYTVVEIDRAKVAMTYVGEAPDQLAEHLTATLNLQPTNY